MMKTRGELLFMQLLLLVVTFSFTACASDDNDSATTATDTLQLQRTFTLKQYNYYSSVGWNVGDKISVYDYTTPNASQLFNEMTCYSLDSDTVFFSGNVTCAKYDYLHVFYPAVGTPGVTSQAVNNTDSLLSLTTTGQDGTWATIRKNYDYTRGVAYVSSMSNLIGSGYVSWMGKMMGYAKINFLKADGDTLKNITNVKIEGLVTDAVWNLDKEQLTISDSTKTINIASSGMKDLYLVLYSKKAYLLFTVTAKDNDGNTHVYKSTQLSIPGITAGTTSTLSYFLEEN